MPQLDIKQAKGATQGSILFLGPNGTISENNINLNWNDSTYALAIAGTLTVNRLSSGGSFTIGANGYVLNTTVNPNAYFEYNHNNGYLTMNTDVHSVTGLFLNRVGTGGNPTASVTFVAGSNGVGYLGIGSSTDRFDFYANGTDKYAGGISGGTVSAGNWGFGTQPSAGAKVYIISENGQGFGTVIATNNLSPAESILQVRDASNNSRLSVSATGVILCDYRFVVGTNLGSITNSSTLLIKGSDSLAATPNFAITDGSNNLLMQFNNDGQLGINSTDFTGGAGGITTKLVVRDSNGDTGYHNIALFENSLNPTSNNVYYNRVLTASAIKYGTYSTYQIIGALNVVNNQGTGALTEVFGTHNYIITGASASISTFSGYYSDKQIQAGTINVASSYIADTTQISGGVTTNLYGLWVKTPTNISGTIINTAAIYIDANLIGTNNYSIISTNALMYMGLGLTNPTSTLHLKGFGTTGSTTVFRIDDSSSNDIMTVYDSGRIGINVDPAVGDRLKITAGSGLDGAINIASNNLANNGYAILAQGGTDGANYNGIWSIGQGGTGTIRAFSGATDYNGSRTNHGGYFSARNGSSESVGVVGIANGGDAVNPGFAAIGVMGIVSASLATNRRAGYFYTSENVTNGISYGVKSEVGNSGLNAVNYGLHTRVNGSTSSAVNYGAWLQADGTSATNYSLVTNGGNIGFGTTTPNNQALLELSSTDQAFLVMRMTGTQASSITASNGMMLYVTEANGTFATAGFWGYESGTWSKFI